jgi:hypothetical protein
MEGRKKKKKKNPRTFGGPNQWDKNATTFMCEKKYVFRERLRIGVFCTN